VLTESVSVMPFLWALSDSAWGVVASMLKADIKAFMHGGPLNSPAEAWSSTWAASVRAVPPCSSCRAGRSCTAAASTRRKARPAGRPASRCCCRIRRAASGIRAGREPGQGAQCGRNQCRASECAGGGNVYALAGNHPVNHASGTALRDGHVWLVADQGRGARTRAAMRSTTGSRQRC
jgi:hypothetical protein